jgi:hypothetical protein
MEGRRAVSKEAKTDTGHLYPKDIGYSLHREQMGRKKV